MSISIARYLICAFHVNAGGTGNYWEHFGSREEKCKELVGTSRRPNVVTSQRRNVGSTKKYKSTSGNVAKSQRRDVSAISTSPSLKAKRGPEFEGIGICTY